jgi:transposase
VDRQYVGSDFHRRRSVIVRMSAMGQRLAVTRVANEPLEISAAMKDAGIAPEVAIEATYGWYWVVDLLQELGATVHLANPKALNWGERRVKSDVIDATDLADMLRLHATQLLAADVRPDVVTERLGHASVAFTLQQYGHRYAGDQRSGLARLRKVAAR